MAINVVFPILIPLEENLHNATRLLSGSGSVPLEFTQPHYCAVLREDAQLAAAVLNVTAIHKEGAAVRYSITGGNRDGLFTIDQTSGLITLAATLDYEVYDKHELVISGEAEGQTAHTIVQVRVADVNDNPPFFIKPDPEVTVIEEDDRHLPIKLLKVEARDKDDLDYQGLLYTVRGDGVDGYKPNEAYFTVNSLTGELIQQRALDRDPPWGKPVWKVRVQVRDGQALWSRPRDKRGARTSRESRATFRNSLKRSQQLENITRRKTKGKDDKERQKRRLIMERFLKTRERKLAKITGRGYLKERRLARSRRQSLSSNALIHFDKSHSVHNRAFRILFNGRFNRPLKNYNNDMNTSFNSAYESNVNRISPNSYSNDNRNDEQYDLWRYGRTTDMIIKDDRKRPVNKELFISRKRTLLRNKRTKLIAKRYMEYDELQLNGRRKTVNMNAKYKLPFDPAAKNFINYPNSSKAVIRSRRAREEKLEDISQEKLAVISQSRLYFAKTLFGNNHPVNLVTPTKHRRRRRKRENSDEAISHPYEFGSFGIDGGCENDRSFNTKDTNVTADPSDPWANTDLSAYGIGGKLGRIHVAETTVTLYVKDINDNPPVFPNATMFGEVQENGPIDLSVAVVSAWDADDINEGTNAKIAYSIEKNVVHERSGEAIFSVHPQTGLISTAVCCLDRETTPEYHIQVVATDGGGLKGTGTVIVRLADVNDNAPRLSKKLWEVEIDETWGVGPPANSTLLEISVSDQDTANYFFYRIVEDSGWGWAHFGIRSSRSSGHLFARKTLDYEDDMQRRGFNFMIQVTDRGRGGWVDPHHLDSAWVKVRLRDLNDNPPKFIREHALVTVAEDAEPGTELGVLTAHDPDAGGNQTVKYRVEDGWGALTIDDFGTVSLLMPLDREREDGAVGTVRILAMDNGNPSLTSTSTLTITVTDVNDCPPSLKPPTVFHITEGAGPSMIGVLTATDPDVWALGHGPPFVFSLAPSNPPVVKENIIIKFDPKLDSGRGGAQVWTKSPLDRELHKELLVIIHVRDAGGLADNLFIKVVIDDVNDNPMKPGRKMVFLWKTQSGSLDAPLGRVYVDDPDDWDLKDKRFRWLGQRHPLFSLNADDGTIFASSQVREGRYELQFAVDDISRGQHGIPANVTVIVQLLNQESLSHSTPITITPMTPEDLTAGWTPQKGGGRLGKLLQAFKGFIGNNGYSVDVLSIYDDTNQRESSLQPSSAPPSAPSSSDYESASPSRPSTCIWVSVRDGGGRFINPTKLQGLIGLNSKKLEEEMNLLIPSKAPINVHYEKKVDDRKGVEESFLDIDSSSSSLLDPMDPSSAASRASTRPPLQVVDTNATSIVTPRLTRTTRCSIQEPETCTPTSCLNGGRCIGTPQGNRCICPSGSWGYQCKILSRTFDGSGFAWIRPLPPCVPTMISLRVLTRKEEALLLYAGPLIRDTRKTATAPPLPLLALQVSRGKVEMVVEGGSEPMKLIVDQRVNDGHWHTIHARLDDEGASLMIDLCEDQKKNNLEGNPRCIARVKWKEPRDAETWFNTSPTQLGGLAHTASVVPNWKDTLISRPLDGCLSHLVINGQLMDMGEPALSKGSMVGCLPQESSCNNGRGSCGMRGSCAGGLQNSQCRCDPGWSGSKCNNPSVPVSLRPRSYIKTTVPLLQPSKVLKVQIRIRVRGRVSGLILKLWSQQANISLSLQLKTGIACSSLTHYNRLLNSICVEGRPIGDGLWHSITTESHGYNMILSIDDGDGHRQNSSLPLLHQSQSKHHQHERQKSRIPSLPIRDSDEDAIVLGGIPELVGADLINLYEDLNDTCLDDLRISGRLVPLSPNSINASWDQRAAFQGIEVGCNAPDQCSNITCTAPLSCFNNWARPTCSCGEGLHLIGGRCEDVDECAWQPCLNGGTCYNMRPGFTCVCGPAYDGKHCQWTNHNTNVHPLASTAAIAVVTFSLLFLVVVGVMVSLRLKRHYVSKNLVLEEKRSQGSGASQISSQEETIIEVKGGTEEGGGGGGIDATREIKDPTPAVILETIKLPHLLPSTKATEKESSSRGKRRLASKSSLEAAAQLAEGGGGAITEDVLTTKDDLRAYAYEGDGSSAGSLASALSGLRVEQSEEGNIQLLAPAFLDVIDLLKNLHEAPNKFTTSSPEHPTKEPKKVSANGAKPTPPTPPPAGEKLPQEGASTSPEAVKENKLLVSSKASQRTSRAGNDPEEISTVC